MSVAPFLLKTYEIISNPSHAEICGWGENDDSIFITNIEEFAKVVLPKYFKHCKYSSFTRQLHKYDFHKTIHNPRHGEFKHKYFIKDRPDLLELIKRKLYVSKKSNISSSPPHDTGGVTDGETDGSSDKDGTGSSETDFDIDFDFDFLNEDSGDDGEEFDFDKYDEIESSVEKGIIAFDNERISVLEKRQAHLLNDNEETKQEIIRTLRENEKMAETMDTLLNIVTHTSQDHSKLVRDDQMEDLCEVMKEKCKLAEMTDETKSSCIVSCIEKVLSTGENQQQVKRKKEDSGIEEEENNGFTDLE